MSKNVKIVKLITGEELLADVEIRQYTPPKYLLKNVVMIAIMPSRSQQAQASIGLAPWMPYAENEPIEVSSDHVVYVAKPVNEMLNQYNSIFGGIIAPSKSLIL